MAAAAASARRTAATNGKDPDRPRRPSKKEADQVMENIQKKKICEIDSFHFPMS